MADKWEAFLISGPEPDGGMQKIVVEYRKRGIQRDFSKDCYLGSISVYGTDERSYLMV